MKNSLKDRLKQIEKEVSKNIDPKKFDFLRTEIPDLIRTRTLLGYGVDEEGAPNSKLKPLSKSYILARQGFKNGEARFMAKKNLTQKDKNKIANGKFSKKTKLIDTGNGFKKLSLVKFKAKNLPELSDKTTPPKSNLTLTGKMLDDIYGIRGNFKFIFGFKTSFSKLKAELVTRGGRRFFDLSKSERNGLQRKISDIIRQEIIKMFNS